MSFEAAQRIRSLLTERGLSERQASIASGLSPATVNALLKRLLRDGDVLPADLAAASGVPWWAASERLDMTPVIFCVYGG